MKLIKIESFENNAHDNINFTSGSNPPVPYGWAILPDGMETPNFPFGSITVDEAQIPPVVTSWTPLPIPEPDPEPESTPAQQREEAYNTQAIIAWDGSMITVTQASQKWQYYAAEGNTSKTDALTALIAEAKASIREQYPD